MPVASLPVSVPSSLPPATVGDVMTEFAGHRRLSVRQRKRWFEILVNWEQKNSYGVYDEDGQHTLQVREEGSGLLNVLKRLLLRTARPFTSIVYDNPIPKPLLMLHRPFRWIFHRLEVTAADGTAIGAIERRWSWVRRIYAVTGPNGEPVAELFGPFLRPWTFEIRVNGEPRGQLQKRWSGFTKELFTDADNFVLDVSSVSDPRLKILAFAATVLIDVVHFEQAKR